MANDVVLDRFGRILVPKALRERQGWIPGMALRLVEDGDGIRISPAAAPSGVGVTVAEGRVVFDAAWHGSTSDSHQPSVAWNPPVFDAESAGAAAPKPSGGPA